MKYLSKNIRFLRELKQIKYSEIKASTGFNASTWMNYENGTSRPNLEDFCKISKLFAVSEYDLLHTDIAGDGNLIKEGKKSEKGNLKGNVKGNLTSVKGGKTESKMPAVVTVDSQGNENIVMVPVRARAGYLNGYDDPHFIEKLPAYRLPGLNNGTFRLFEVEGLSMYPTLHSGDLIIGSFIENYDHIRDDRVYVIVTKNEGVVVKRVLNRITKDGKLILKSDNHKDRDMYPPIIIDPHDVIEVWYATGYISRQLRPPAETYNRVIDLEGRLTLLEDALKKGQGKLT